MTKDLVTTYQDSGLYTDKWDLGYLDNFYNEFLKQFDGKSITMFEIGISGGGSIRLWQKYFSQETEIYAGDIQYHHNCTNDIHLVIGDCYSDQIVNRFESEKFDLMIDDGPHTYESFVSLISLYYDKIKTGGFLIVEDVIESAWVQPLVDIANEIGYSDVEVIDMTGKQKFPALLERWKDGLFILKLTK